MARYEPKFEKFAELAQNSTVVPVHRELLADASTPVGAAAAFARIDGSYLLESVVGGEKWGRYSFIGHEPDMIVRGTDDRFERIGAAGKHVETGVDPFVRLREVLAEWKPPPTPWLPRFWGGAVGYVSYDAVRHFEPTVAPPLDPSQGYLFSFAIGGTVLVFDNLRHTLRVVVPTRIEQGEDLRKIYDATIDRIERAVARLREPVALRNLPPPDNTLNFGLPPSNFSAEGYMAAVNRAKEYIAAGDIFQVVLSQRFRLQSSGLCMFDVYRAMRVLNPSPYMFYLKLPEVTIAGASPESHVRVESGVADLRPLAGTRKRGASEEEDRRVEAELLADPKEIAEHVMLVDLGRNDLGRISLPGTVRVTEKMIIERYSHVMHIVSNVRGKLAPGRDAIDVLKATFPAGTLSGAPKVRAMQIIHELEPEHRGIYGGAVGYLGFDGNMDVAIAIRTVVEQDNQLHLQAGAGIVEASDPKKEYEETVNKARAGLLAVAAAERARVGDGRESWIPAALESR